jgi:protocatechuate 3,4-dioxygenase beta subunit
MNITCVKSGSRLAVQPPDPRMSMSAARVRSALWLVLLTLAPRALAGQEPAPLLVGVVTDRAGNPIANARVSVLGTEQTALTGPDGHYAFTSIPDGRYAVRAQVTGFMSSERDFVTITLGKTAHADFRLRPAGVPAAPQKPPH